MRFGFSIGFQLYEWEVEIEIPREYRFRSEREARTACREMNVEAIVFPNQIAVLFERDYMMLEDRELYNFRKLKVRIWDLFTKTSDLQPVLFYQIIVQSERDNV